MYLHPFHGRDSFKKVGHVTLATPLKSQFIFRWLLLATVHLFTNFEMSSLKYIGTFWKMDPRNYGQSHGRIHICRAPKRYPLAGCNRHGEDDMGMT